MRIDGNTGAVPPQVASKTSETAESNSASASAAETLTGGILGEDQADLSGGYVQVEALTAQALQFPEVRQEKVNALRQGVENGTYQPSSDQVAQAMLAEMVALPAA